ncbi:MAG: NAD(P)/FAD-dependent oxidoreductase [Phycisphaerae bacterium]|nr:NAD(P)/FAD-dependent oxidoreductase [Phycisphaerae bacterium]
MPDSRVAIIGGGYSGLAAAYELAKNGLTPIVFEAGRAPGGLAGSVRLGNTHIERYYHHWFTHDDHVLDLVKELGLQRHLVVHETNTSNYHDNQVYRLSSPLDVLRFGPLRLSDRMRLGRMALKGRSVRDYRRLEGKTARKWITEMAGPTVYDVVWRPLFEGKFGPYADEVSAVWFWSKLQTRGRSRSKRQREQLAYLDGGFQRLTDALVGAVISRGGQVRVSCPVSEIRRRHGQWEVVSEGGCESFDQILVTTPTPIAAEIIPDLPEAYRHRTRAIPYLGVTELMLVLNRRLSPTYWLNVNDPGYPFIGVIEHTNFQPPEAYGGRHVVYLTKYRDAGHEAATMDQASLIKTWLSQVQRMFPTFEESWVRHAQVWKDAYAQPVVRAGCESQIPPAETPLPGIWMCSMAQVYPEDRGTNYAIQQGRRTARGVLEAIERPERRPQAVRIACTTPIEQAAGPAEPIPAFRGLSPA